MNMLRVIILVYGDETGNDIVSPELFSYTAASTRAFWSETGSFA